MDSKPQVTGKRTMRARATGLEREHLVDHEERFDCGFLIPPCEPKPTAAPVRSGGPTLSERFEMLAKAATPGPWHVGEGVNDDNVIDQDGYGVCEVFPRGGPQDDDVIANVDFIAFCGTHRDEIAAALRAVQAVRELHYAEHYCKKGHTTCRECDVDWPCATIRALDAAREAK